MGPADWWGGAIDKRGLTGNTGATGESAILKSLFLSEPVSLGRLAEVSLARCTEAQAHPQPLFMSPLAAGNSCLVGALNPPHIGGTAIDERGQDGG